MKSNASSKIIISLVMLAAIAIAIIACSLAWFSVSGANQVTTSALELDSAVVSNMVIDTQALESYTLFMGQTGTKYDTSDHDSPYFLTYTPFIVDVGNLDLDKYGPYFCYNFSDLTQIKFVFASSTPRPITPEETWDNFCMELHVAEQDAVTEEYTETGLIYRSENGFFRDPATGELLSFAEDGRQVFVLYIYFQSDVARNLLMTTHNDIAEKYAFGFTDTRYMHCTFTLSAVFSMKKMNRLTFLCNGYNVDADYAAINLGSSGNYVYNCTGCSLYDAEGNEQQWPIAEFYDSGVVDYSYYFVDWASRERNPEVEDATAVDAYDYFIYRSVSTADNIYTLSLRPLRADNSLVTALCGQSPKLTLDLGIEGQDDVECYMRPAGRYYDHAGKATYSSSNQRITVTNPTINKAANANTFTESTVTSFTYTPPPREGYYFVGWSASETPTYTNGVLNDAFGTNGFSLTQDTTLYAVWKELAYIDIVIPTKWGNNYATISNISLLDGNNNPIAVDSDGHARIQAEKGTSAYAALQYLSATATATFSDSTTRALTLKCFNYYKSSTDKWETLSAGNTFNLNDEVSVVLIWNERTTYTITVDLFQAWDPPASTIDYDVGAQMKITSSKEDTYRLGNSTESGGYTILYNGNTTTSFTGSSSSQTLTISNIPEGMKLSDILAEPDPKTAHGGYVANTYTIFKWSSTNNNWEGTALNSYYSSAATITPENVVVNDTFISTLTSNTIYALFRRAVV